MDTTNPAHDPGPSEARRPPRRPPLRERLAFLAIRNAFRVGSRVAPGLTAEKALRYFITPTRIPRPGWEAELVKSARRLELKADVVAYAFGKGPRVLLVHGWDGRGTQMGRIATALADAGFEAICLDLPGHGESPGRLLHIPAAADTLLEVGAELGPLRAIVGHSFGAGASLLAVRRGLRAERIAYLAGPGRFTALFDRYCAWVGVGGEARRRFDEKIVELVRMDPATNTPAEWVKETDLPALIVHDRDDEDAPFSEGEEIHRNWRGSRFLPTSGLGHRRILKAKPVIAAIVEFVRGA